MPGSRKFILIAACLLALTGVQLGALGAHALDELLTPQKINSWELAVQYQLVHSLGLLLVVWLQTQLPDSALLRWAAGIMLAGIFLFSGSIYVGSLGGPGFIGQLAPFGGSAFMVAWLLVAIAVFRH